MSHDDAGRATESEPETAGETEPETAGETERQYTIRWPLGVLERVRHCAREDRRSVNQQVVWMVEEALRRRGR